MYSDAIEKILDAKRIKLGDHVKLKGKEHVFEGVLMPRSDAGNNQILVLKMKNGYNVGIKFDRELKVEKIRSGSGSFSSPQEPIKFRSSLNRVDLLYTGGTIGAR